MQMYYILIRFLNHTGTEGGTINHYLNKSPKMKEDNFEPVVTEPTLTTAAVRASVVNANPMWWNEYTSWP